MLVGLVDDGTLMEAMRGGQIDEASAADANFGFTLVVALTLVSFIGIPREKLAEALAVYHLLRNIGRVLTRDVLLSAVWGYDYYGTTRTVDVHVRRLKQKLPLLDDAIISIKSLGYKLRESDVPA